MAEIEKVFKAYDVRGIYGSEIDEDLAWKIGHASAAFLRSMLSGYERGQASSNRLIVGHDMRPSSQSLVAALLEGVTSSGASVIDIGLCDTPMVYFAINYIGTCGGIQVTASHNPMEYNGFKVSGLKAKPIGADTGLKEIQRIVGSIRRMPLGASLAPVQKTDLWAEYRAHVLKFLKAPRRLKVVVDASNGMAGKMVPGVFHDTDIEIIPLNFEIGGEFAHPPNPIIEDNLRQLQKAIQKHKADFGVCFDGDADRCMFVDENGIERDGDYILAILARDLLAQGKLAERPEGAPVRIRVTDEHLEKNILSLSGGGKVREYRLVYKVSLKVTGERGNELIAPIELEQVREFSYDDALILAKEAEEASLQRGMEQEALRQALRRLSYVKR